MNAASISLVLLGLLFAWFAGKAWRQEMRKASLFMPVDLLKCAYLGIFALFCLGGAIAVQVL